MPSTPAPVSISIARVLQIRVAGQLLDTEPGLDRMHVRRHDGLLRVRPVSALVAAQRLGPGQGAHVHGRRRVRGRLLADFHAVRGPVLQAPADQR